MNGAHVHLMLNHVPVLAALGGVALLGYSALRRSDEARRIALAVLVLAALVAIPVFFSGGRAEKHVEHMPGVSERVIDPHEDAGKIALALIELAGLAALGGLLAFRRKSEPRVYRLVTMVLALAAALQLAWTAYLGGLIRHTEIRPGSTTQSAPDND